MKNSKGISLIALIITIIVIIILAAIVIAGVFNTPNDAKFANFCQEYDRVQTAIQLKYYELYQKYTLKNTTKVPTHYDIYNEVATGVEINTAASNYNPIDEDAWVKIVDDGWAKLCTKPSGLVDDTKGNVWYLRLSDGKLAYSGFEKEEAIMYYTPNICEDNSVGSISTHVGTRAKLVLASDGNLATTTGTDMGLDSTTTTTTQEQGGGEQTGGEQGGGEQGGGEQGGGEQTGG